MMKHRAESELMHQYARVARARVMESSPKAVFSAHYARSTHARVMGSFSWWAME
jgi:hypothetical protein